MLHVTDLTFRIDGRTLLDRAGMALARGHRAALVGRNGSGKSTLLRLIAGELDADGGSISVPPRARVLLVGQTAPAGRQCAQEVVLAADSERAGLVGEAERLERAEGADATRLAEVHARLGEIRAHAAPARAAAILHGLGFDADDQRRPLDDLSGGWRMRAALAGALFAEPDLLLLDEPTNHLDLEASLWLTQYLARWPRTLLVASHDRALINRIATETIHLDDRRLVAYRGGFDAFERARRERLQREAAVRAGLDARRRHLQAFVDRFRAKATKARQAQSRLKALARLAAAPPPPTEAHIAFAFPEPAPLAPPLISLDRVSAGYQAGRPVLRGLDLRLDMDDRIALLGANGNGKTTLLRVLAGRLAPLSGERRADARLVVGLYAQDQAETLDGGRTAYQHVAERMAAADETARRAHLGRFGLGGALADQPAGALSGGERVRLVMALICCAAPQLLLLDEPTNHLDADARAALVEALNAFSGAVVLITHDRHLIELCADRLWLVAAGTCRPFDGDLDDYQQALLAERAGDGNGGARRPAGGSKARRRQASAARRAAVAPLRQAAQAAEREVDRLERDRAGILRAIADPGLYAGAPARLAELGRTKRRLERELEAAEQAWLAAQDALERALSKAG